MFRFALTAAAAVLAAAQPDPVTLGALSSSGGNVTIAFTAASTGIAAASFEVTANPEPFFSAPTSAVYWGERSGLNAISPPAGADNVLDTTRWQARAGTLCPLSTVGTCLTTSSTITTVSRQSVMLAHHGHQLDVNAFWRHAGGISSAPDIRNGVPMLEPRIVTGRVNRRHRIESVVTAFGVTYDWNRYSWSGMLLYDVDINGRIRPILRTGLNEYWGRYETMYPQCTGVPSTTSTCTWLTLGATFSVGGSVTQVPTVAAPWRYILDIDPVAQTVTPAHVHPTFGAWTGQAFSLNPTTMSSLMGTYWSSYLNSASFGLFNASNLRVASIVETNGGAGSSFGMTVERMFAYEWPVSVAARLLYGSTSGPDGIVATGAADNVLDTTRYSLTNVPSGACPLSTGACTTNPSIANVLTRVARLQAFHGHQFQIGPFMTQLSTTSQSMQNGVPILEVKYTWPSEPARLTVEVSSFLITYDWNRFSWSGLMLYDLDAQGRVRPLMKTGLYEWLGYLAMWVPYCNPTAPTTCSWNQLGTTFSIGGSVTTAPTAAAPWRYGLIRNSAAGTWQAAHTHPTSGAWPLTSAPIFAEANMASLMGAYWTNYVNNPTYGVFDPANIKVGLFVESQSGTGTAFGFTAQRAYAESTIEATIFDQANVYTGLANTASTSGSQCGFNSRSRVVVSRTDACGSTSGTTCSVNLPLALVGVNHTVSVTALSSTNARSATMTTSNAVTSAPALPVAGAQLWLDAAAMPSWLGATNAAVNLVCPAGVSGVCRPNAWWHDLSGNGYLFGQMNTATRPVLKSWSVDQPYQSFVFDGVDDNMALDVTQWGRDNDFNLQFNDQTGFFSGADSETTWFLLYRPSESISLTASGTAFAKGVPSTGSGSSYQWYTQRAIQNPPAQFSTYDQFMGFSVAGDNGAGRGAVVGQRYVSARTTATGNPHALGGVLITATHYRNTTGGMNANRGFRLDACEGVQNGNFLTDRCSYSGGTAPGDRWSAVDGMGTTVVRPSTMPAQVPPGTNWVDYTVSGAGQITSPNRFPRASGLLSLGTAYAGAVPQASYFRGQIMSLVMYRRRLSDAERRSVQTYLLDRYGQLCPSIPTPPGALNGCDASGTGAVCLISCNSAASPPRSRIGGTSSLTCVNGGWRGKMTVCGTTCPTRSSPRDYATCTQMYGNYDFSTAEYPLNTANAYSSMRFLDSLVPASAQASLMDRAWSVQNLFGSKFLVGTPVLASGCNPVATGPLHLMENSPVYWDKLAPGARMVVEGTVRLLSPGTQAGISARTGPQGSYRILLGQAATTANRAVTLQKVIGTTVTTLSSSPVVVPSADWDTTGATEYRLRMTVTRRNAVDLTQNVIVELVSLTGTSALFNFNDLNSPMTLGGGGLVVVSGSAGFGRLMVMGDCDQQGAVCQLYEGQSCSWTCAAGSQATLGSAAYTAADPYWETCLNGAMPTGNNVFSCVPLPPVFPAATLNITEGAVVGSTAGVVRATPINPKHVALYTMQPVDNSETIFGSCGQPLGTVTDVFAVGACTGEVILNRGGALNFDAFPSSKRTFNLIVTACTNGNPLACANASTTVRVLNVPSAPFYCLDTDLGNPNRASGVWQRSFAENSAAGTLALNALGSAAGLPIVATSPENSPLRYRIAFGNTNDAFMINATTGHLMVNAGARLDFETLNTYNLIVEAVDTTNANLSSTVQVIVRILDRNDPPVAVSPQYLSITESQAIVANAIYGRIMVTDQDAGEIINATFYSQPAVPSFLTFNNSGLLVQLSSRTSRPAYPAVETAPLTTWRNQQVREVIRVNVRLQDRAGAFVNVAVEIGVVAEWTPSADPVANGVRVPNTVPNVPGLWTTGNENITISGTNFNSIRTTYSNVLSVTLNSQDDDRYPNRTYICSSPRVIDDSTIVCLSPHAWGKDLVVRITYGATRRNMASTAPLVVSYAPPTVSVGTFSLGGRFSFPSDLLLGSRDFLPTQGNLILLLSAQNLGTRADAPSILRVEYGNPIPGTDELEYKAPYVPCPPNRTYESWSTPTTPNGVTGRQTRVCILVPPGIGTQLRFQIRVGTQVSNMSGPDPGNPGFGGWFIGYSAPSISRVWKPINLNGDAPAQWDNTQNGGNFNPGETVWFNGTNFGPADKIPMVTFNLPSNTRVMYDNGRSFFGVFNFTPPVRASDGQPNCWKPFGDGRAHTVMACEVPYGSSSGVRIRLQLGSNAHTPTSWPPSITFNPPVLQRVVGAAATRANTEGGQAIVVEGLLLGPLPEKWTELTSNTYASKPYPPNANTLNYLPLTLWYGPNGNEYLATNCAVTSERPSQVTCLTAPGVGRNFLYRLSSGGQNATVRMLNNGYAPPLISSVTRVPEDQVYDASLDGVPGPKDYKAEGGEAIVINGANFGPCPGSCTFLDRQPTSRFNAQYYVQLNDNRTEYGTTIGDASRRIWYRAVACNMTVPHRQIICRSAIGAGGEAVVRVTISGQDSVLPTTSYAVPAITSLSIDGNKPAAAADGGDVLVIGGTNFGPRNNCRTGGVACRGMIQAITYGPTGREYAVADWEVSTADNTVRATLAPGLGSNLKVVIKVADQESMASDATFNYAPPALLTITPGNGPTDPTELKPVPVTITGNNFGLLNPSTDLFVVFGNSEDGTMIRGIAPTSVFPDRRSAADRAAFLAQPLPRTERVTFNLPRGLGQDRSVRLMVIDKSDPNAVEVFSNALLFDYDEPRINSIVVEALRQFANESDVNAGVTDEWAMASTWFPDTFGSVRKVTMRGVNFGDNNFGFGVFRQVDMRVDSSAEWESAVFNGQRMPNHAVLRWSPEEIVALTTFASADVRVSILAKDNMAEWVNSTSNVRNITSASPQISNIVGSQGPFNTAGGETISFAVLGLSSTAFELAAFVELADRQDERVPCPFVWAAGDARGAGNVVPQGDLLNNMVLNQDGGSKYYDTTFIGPDSVWTLFCRLPAGEGKGAKLIIKRDGQDSSPVYFDYARPSITKVEILRAAGNWEVLNFAPGMLVSVPTLGTDVKVFGSNFGLCPSVRVGLQRVDINNTGCAEIRGNIDETSNGTNVLSPESVLSFTVPPGESAEGMFEVLVGGQSSLDTQIIDFAYFPPTITSVTPEGRTAGGDIINITGADFGTVPPIVQLHGGSDVLTCLDVIRMDGVEGHSFIQCTLPEGSGVNMDVSVNVGGQTDVASRVFSYSRPYVTEVVLNGTAYNMSDPALEYLTGATTGNYVVTLRGDNFGSANYDRHCLFVAWRARNRAQPFRCNRQEDFVGEGEIPVLALNTVRNESLPWSHTEVSFLFPPGLGIREIVPFVNGNTPVAPPVFRYSAPNITSELNPNFGTTNGGTELSVQGFNFGLPVVDTTTAEGRRDAQTNRTVAVTLEDYLKPRILPQAALLITFGRGCVVNYATLTGSVPAALRTCERGGVMAHTQTELKFKSAGGVGTNVPVTVKVWDQEPDPAVPNTLVDVYIESEPVFFNYLPPSVTRTLPRPVPMDDTDGGVFTIEGDNFGSLELANLQGWTAEERVVNLTINGQPIIAAERLIAADRGGVKVDRVRVTVGNLAAGYHNMTYTVAGQTGSTPADPPSSSVLFVGCKAGSKINYRTEELGPFGGFFGREGETCAPCPPGAICLGFDVRFGPRDVADPGQHMYPIPVIGFYNLNSSDAFTTGMYDACPDEVKGRYPGRDVCVVRCDPPEACLGNNECAPEYVSKAPMFRCASCAPGFYKRATTCVKCPDSPWALVIGFVLLVVVGGGLAYSLNRMRINIAYVAIAIDYFQVLAIFANSRVQWPAAIQELFHVLSAFNLNIEIVAPECIVPDLGFQRKWSFVMALPISLQVFFAIVTGVNSAYKVFVKGQKVKLSQVGAAMMASVLMVMYIMYIYLTRNILDIYNCKPTDPPDGKTYLTAVFEECGKPGGVQMTLLFPAIVATIVYIIGYPAGIAYLMWKNRELVMEDQLLRAKGVGDDRATNPHAYDFRKRWGRLYYQFKPDTVMWILAIILRKFLIAATYVLFNTQPSFQLAAVFLIIFLAYSAQMRFSPYLSPQDFDAVLDDHRKKALTDVTHQRLKATLDSISTRGRKVARKNLLNNEGKIDTGALLGVLRGWLFNYNTVEQLLLFSAGTVCLMGMMFAAQSKKQSTYKESRDSLTAVVIGVVAISIIYLFTVFVTEVTVLAGESNRKKAARSAVGKKGGDEEVQKGKKERTAAAAAAEKDFDAGNVESATNPMFLGGGNKPATPKSPTAEESVNVEEQIEAMEAADAIAAMRDPPASKDMWLMYKEKYEELASTVEDLKAQIAAAPPGLRAGPSIGASDV